MTWKRIDFSLNVGMSLMGKGGKGLGWCKKSRQLREVASSCPRAMEETIHARIL